MLKQTIIVLLVCLSLFNYREGNDHLGINRKLTGDYTCQNVQLYKTAYLLKLILNVSPSLEGKTVSSCNILGTTCQIDQVSIEMKDDSSTVTKWCINCQRCVPTYELLMLNDLLRSNTIDKEIYDKAVQKIETITKSNVAA